MRVTNHMLVETAARALTALRSRMARAQEQVATGNAITRPSDGPARTVTALDLGSARRRVEQADAGAAEALNWLSVSEQQITRMIDMLQAAREAALVTGGPGARDPVSREGVAQTVEQARAAALHAANTRYRGVYLFAGFRTDTAPFAPDAAAYLGDEGVARQEVVPGQRLPVRLPGSRLLGGGNFFQALEGLAADIRSGAPVAGRLEELDRALEHLSSLRTEIGVRLQQVDEYADMNRKADIDLQDRLARATGTELERAVTELAEIENAYRAALGAAGRALPASLMDFLR